MNLRRLFVAAVLVVTAALPVTAGEAAPAAAGEAAPVTAGEAAPSAIAVKTGDKIAFLGDSITQFGWTTKPTGYVHLVIDGLKRAGVNAVPVPAGVSGNKSTQMLARLDKDVLSKKPQWMLLSCGVNDVWHGKKGVVLEDYKKNITAIVDQADKAGIKVMILTATMIRENAADKGNVQLADYNAFLRQLAAERKYLLADLNADMQAIVARKKVKNDNAVTVDGVHMNGYGNQMMASGILKAFGVSDESIASSVTAWNDLPGAFSFRLSIPLSINEFKKIHRIAAEKKITPKQYLDKLLHDAVRKALE